MKKLDLVMKYIERTIPDLESADTGLVALGLVAKFAQNELDKHRKLQDVFTETGMGDIFVKCPDCGSPVLLNYKDCNVCGLSLIEADTKATSKKKTTKKKAASKKKVEEPEEDEVEEVEETPVKKKTTKKKVTKKAASKKKVEEPEEDEVEEDDLPSEDEVNKMRKAGLVKLIETHKLDIDAADWPKLADLREAVNDAIDQLCSDEDEDASELEDDELEEYDEEESEDEESDEDEEYEDEESDEEYEDEDEEDDEESDEEDDDLEDFDLDDVDMDDIDDLEDDEEDED